MIKQEITSDEFQKGNWDGILIDAEIHGIGCFRLQETPNGSHLKQMYELLKCDCVDYVSLGTVTDNGITYSIDLWINDNGIAECDKGFLLGEPNAKMDGYYYGSGIILAANESTGETVPIPEKYREPLALFVMGLVKFWQLRDKAESAAAAATEKD